MKVMVSAGPKGLLAYVARKDLEEPIVETEKPGLWGGWARLGNGWMFQMPDYADPPALPVTVEARRLTDAEG